MYVGFSKQLSYMFTRDFSSFDIMLLHLKLQTCFVLPGLISAINSATDQHTQQCNR